MANSQESTGIVSAQACEDLNARVAWGALSRRLAATMLPLALLLADFAAIEPRFALGGRNPPVFTSFWYHYGALALCYMFGLHWTEQRRIVRATVAAMLAAATMTLVTVILTFVGIATGIATAVVFIALLHSAAGFYASFVVVPGLAGTAWGIAVAIVAHRLSGGSEFPEGWLRLHGWWGVVAGPLMLWSTLAVPFPGAPALATTAATLSLTLLSWWWIRRCRRPLL
jgi:hypothetical protein